ncbi:MAG TPA: tetratricopeptide repeat protein [Thermoanaerobaculia bacterium]|nr:tetratricopeptide repeat protein [Thermoanaerobaculia bacterium]
MRREHRRELKHDRFVDEIGTLSTRARENQRFLLTVTLAVVVVALAVYGFFYYRSTREQRAQDALAVAVETIDSPLLPAPGGQPVPGAKFKTEAERSAAAEKRFKDVQTKYSGTDASDVAGLYVARFDAGRGDIAGARRLIDQFIREHPKHVLVGSARFSLYQLRIENGEAGQVANELQAEVSKTDPILPADSLLLLLAHAYDAQGNAAKSKDAYRRIATEFPDSPYALEAQRRMGPA